LKRRDDSIRHWWKFSRCVLCWLGSQIYNMCTGFFPLWVGLSFSRWCNYLFEKGMMQTTNGKSHGNSYILPAVGWISVMIWYIMDVSKQSVFLRSSLIVISYTHFFIIAYKLHRVCVIERGLSSSIYFRHLYIYVHIKRNQFFSIVLISMRDDLIRVINSKIFKIKWLHTIFCEKCQLKYMMN
jgi:hypothetical protein